MKYRMKAVMEKTGMTEKTIRYYIEKELIRPEEVRSNGRNNYFFSQIDLQILGEISFLRAYDFSIQDIKKILYGGRNELKQVLKVYGEILQERQLLYSIWKNSAVDIEKVENKEQLIEVLKKNGEMVWREKTFSVDFGYMDAEEENGREEREKPYKKFTIFMVFLLLILFGGSILGVTLGVKWSDNMAERKNQAENLEYGIVENSISVSDIQWKDFPGWREVSCAVQGDFSVMLPKNANIVFVDLVNSECLKETAREHQVISDGKELIYCDYVTYEVENGLLEGNGLLKEYGNDIVKATTGYKMSLTWEGGECFLGYISPLSEEIQWWTKDQNAFAGRNLTPYLDAFTLSRTYVDSGALSFIEAADNVKLLKTEGGLLDCVIKNEGTVDWSYKATLPTLELWYNGVWIELKTDWDDALMGGVCFVGQQKVISVPVDTTDKYPALFAGIYRLVIYGTEGDCVISEVFMIKEE